MEKTSQADSHPSFTSEINKLAAKYLVPFQKSGAFLHRTPTGYYVEISMTDTEAWDSIKDDPAFRKAFDTLMIPWALGIPSVKGTWFRGFIFNAFDSEEEAEKERDTYKIIAELGADILHVVPKGTDPGRTD